MMSICFTISPHHPKETFFFSFFAFFLVRRKYSKNVVLTPPMSPITLEGQVVRMIDLISIFARQSTA